MNVLLLCFRDEPIREFGLSDRPLEVGCGAGCDIVVHDPGVRERHLLVRSGNGTVLVHELSDGRCGTALVLGPSEPMRLGRFHSLVRVPDAPTRPRSIVGTTEPLSPLPRHRGSGLSVTIGRGRDARRLALHDHPLSIGSQADSDLVMSDRAVSARHCRLEPGEDGWRVRDLGSRNGTSVDGVPIMLARIEAGSTIRVGRTDLRVIAREGKEARGLVAHSAGMREVLGKIERYARLLFPVLIVGESGTGKEGLARALHASGPRASGPFIAINAGGMPRSLVESELFGHERGAFTGAMAQHRGVFEQAHEGTLFLDEIGELPLDLQARLLRVLETWEVRRVGGERAVNVNVRLVCATHRDLQGMVADGAFRQDLYYRIAHLVAEVPSLRERPEDLGPLAEHFLKQCREQLGPRTISPPAVSALLSYAWPGNVRELRNLVLRAAANCAGQALTAEDIESALREAGCAMRECDELNVVSLERVLSLHNYNLTATARALGMPRTTLRDRLKTARRRSRGNSGE